jgi:hypothetical protein
LLRRSELDNKMPKYSVRASWPIGNSQKLAGVANDRLRSGMGVAGLDDLPPSLAYSDSRFSSTPSRGRERSLARRETAVC